MGLNRMEMPPEQLDRIRGVFYGQAIGDALGLGTEFMTKEEVSHHYPAGLSEYAQIIRDNHRKRWELGAWTDDTDQFLCIRDSILKVGKVDECAFAEELFRWYQESSLGIGNTVLRVVTLPQFTLYPHKGAELVWKTSKRQNASNGAVMRTSILGTYEFWDPDAVVRNTETICKVTHWDSRCIGSCAIVTLLIARMINEREFLDREQIGQIAERYDERIKPFIELAYQGDIAQLQLDEPASIGYTLKALAAGLWAYFHAGSFEEGLRAVINEGGDADTNASVAGSLLGAKFGYQGIPSRYIHGLLHRDKLEQKLEEYLGQLNKLAADRGLGRAE
ncbi:MAG TPA: ADP-ribosylglycohydrolase family protein [Flavobacteriales bacterium]|nr:ADP-ribosylglycohydrolase family protein [Flavobacteriales bacterium]